MNSKFLMNRQKILLYFTKLNELLRIDDVFLEIFVSGGANMCLYIQSREATHDIDVSTRSMDLDGGIESEIIYSYAERVSNMMNIPFSWLNTGGNLYVTPQMLERSVKGIELSNLTVWFFDWVVMLVQKVAAGREQPDITDAVAIIRKYKVTDIDILDKWMKELQGKWYSMSSRYKAENILTLAWDTDETPYIRLRTLLDTFGFRDKTVDYYAGKIISDLGLKSTGDIYQLAFDNFSNWQGSRNRA